MRIFIKSIFSALFIFFICNKISAQRIDSVLSIYANVFQPERAYLQFDKPAYSPGETIWFKAYLMQGIYPAGASKNFYVDWTDDDGNILYHTTTPIIEASARGQFEIPSNFSGTTIHVRAYTSWMLNFDSAFLYNKNIHIIQKSSTQNNLPTIISSIQFFPEGGDAIEGLKNKIAFKANDQFGRPVKVRGGIINSKGLLVDSFKAMHDGMGFFFLQPEANETYTAKWFDEQKNLHQTTLPAAKSSGVNLEISDIEDSSRKFIVTRSENVDENLKQLHIIATLQQQLVYMANINLVGESVSGYIPVAQLPTGVLQITVFDKNWQPLAERITFVNNHDAEFAPEVGFSVLGLSKRQRNVLVIDVPDSIQSNLSVSVTDAGISSDSSDNIISHLLLTGDLHGAVYDPSFYFSDNKNAQQYLDLVMLTHGWRRFNWQNVVQGNLPEIKYPHDATYVNLSGKIFGATPDQLRDAKYMLAFVMAKDSSRQTYTIPIEKNGTFSKPELVFYDTLKIFYAFPTPKMADMTEVAFYNGLLPSSKHVFIDRTPENNIMWFDTSGSYRNAYLALQAARLKSLSEGLTLKDVTVKTRAKSPLEIMDDRYTSGLFSGDMDDVAFDVLDDKSAFAFPSVFTYLQGKVAGLQISVSGTNDVTLTWRGSTPDVYLDEMKVDVSQLQSLSMDDVAYVKVFRPPFFGTADGGAGGAIAVYTKKGNDQQTNEKKKGLPYKFVAGYSAVKEFYSPNYGTFDEKNEAADLRSTLYWNPMIFTNNEKHIVRFEFYNNDVTNSFRVVLEGMSKDGKLTRIEKVIE